MKLLEIVGSNQSIRLPILAAAGFTILFAITNSLSEGEAWFGAMFLVLATALHGLAIDTASVPFARVAPVLLAWALGAAVLWFATGDVLILLSLMHGDPTFRIEYLFSALIVAGFYFLWALIGRWQGRD